MDTINSGTPIPSTSTIQSLISDAALKYDKQLAFHVSGKEALSYRELLASCKATWKILSEAGINQHDRIAVLLPQGPENALVCLSVMSVSTCVPLNPEYKEAELEALFKQLNIRLIITAYEVAAAVINVANTFNIATLVLNIPEEAPAGVFVLEPTTPKLTLTANDTVIDSAPLQHTDIALILHTSGSTGLPKAVPLTHQNLLTSSNNLISTLKLTADDCALNMMPLFHIGALLDLMLAPLAVGGRIVFSRDMSADSFFKALDAFKPSWYQAVPTMMQDLLAKAKREQINVDCSSLRFCRSVSSPLPAAIREAFEDLFKLPVIEIYGMTETAGVITSNTLANKTSDSGTLDVSNTVGKSAGPDIQIADNMGNPAKVNQRGEVIVRGNNVFSGYLGSEPQNEDFINDWFKTGDEGYLDERGQLFLSGRIKDIINRGGEKISPIEVDTLLRQHPLIDDAACFAFTHLSLGEDIAAAIVLKPSSIKASPIQSKHKVNEHELRAFLASSLAQHKIPHHMFFVKQLPRTSGGKLQRHCLTEEFCSDASRRDTPTAVELCSEQQTLIASIWKEVLAVPSVNIDDDFFDLGGDSLSATEFITALEKNLGRSVEMGLFYDHPTLSEFDAFLSEQLAAQDALASSKQDEMPAFNKSKYLSEEVYNEIANFMSAWQGLKKTPDSLIVGLNTLGSKPAIFYGCQGNAELQAFADLMGPEQPVYGFRSLMELHFKSPENEKALSKHFAEEIRASLPNESYIIGGFCAGGRFAFEIAQQLKLLQEKVQLLFLIETFIPRHYDGRTALFYVKRSKQTPYRHFYTPERGWPKYYSGELSVTFLHTHHVGFFKPPEAAVFADHLKHEIDGALNCTPSKNSLNNFPTVSTQVLPENGFQAKISSSVDPALSPEQSLNLKVVLENKSQVTWLPSKQSGIFLANRWRKRKNNKVKVWKDGLTELTEPVAPGEKVTLNLKVIAPTVPRPWILEIDLIDEGVCWFQDYGSSPARLKTQVIYGARFWHLIRDKIRIKKQHAY